MDDTTRDARRTPTLRGRLTKSVVSVAAGLLVVGGGLIGCSSAPKRPSWVANPYEGYDKSEYIAASGRGASMSEAETDATAGVAQELAREIDHQTIDLDDYERRVSRAGFDPGRTVELLRLGEFDESRRVLGFDVTDRYEEKLKDEPTRYFARGVVDRDDLSRAYETEMRRNASFGNRMIDRAESEPVTMRKFAALRAALATAEVFRDLRFIRSMVGNPAYAGDDTLNPPGKTVDRLNAEIAELRSKVAASIEPKGAARIPPQIEAELRGSLQELGVPVKTDAGEGQVRILVEWGLDDIHQQRQDVELKNFRLGIEVVEDVSGYSLATSYWDAREGGADERDAEAAAIRIARREMARDLDTFLREALFEQSLNAQ